MKDRNLVFNNTVPILTQGAVVKANLSEKNSTVELVF